MARSIKQVAVSLLARREHSAQELAHKLQQRGYAMDAIAKTINELQQHNLQSDQRFTELYIRSRATRGYGPIWIKQSLSSLGVADMLIEQELTSTEIDWVECIQQVAQKKFGAQWSGDLKQKRFLQYRGFTNDQIRALS